MEPKLTKIALNRFQKPHRRTDNRQGSSVRDIFIENSMVFLNWNRFFPIQTLIIPPLRNARRGAQITTLTQRSRPISLKELGIPVVLVIISELTQQDPLTLYPVENGEFSFWQCALTAANHG